MHKLDYILRLVHLHFHVLGVLYSQIRDIKISKVKSKKLWVSKAMQICKSLKLPDVLQYDIWVVNQRVLVLQHSRKLSPWITWLFKSLLGRSEEERKEGKCKLAFKKKKKKKKKTTTSNYLGTISNPTPILNRKFFLKQTLVLLSFPRLSSQTTSRKTAGEQKMIYFNSSTFPAKRASNRQNIHARKNLRLHKKR